MTGSGEPGKVVVVRVLGEAPFISASSVGSDGQYAVDLKPVLQALGKDGLEVHQSVQAEMDGQTYQTQVQSPPQGENRIFLPIVINTG